MSIDNDTQDLVQDELASLKQRAELLGLTFHPSIGLDKLRDKVNAAQRGEEPTQDATPIATPAVETEGQMRGRLKKDANELVRVIVTCMNPAKAEWEGEILTAGNALVGSFTKFVPFNNEDGWHVPKIILQMMQDRQCQIFVASKDSRGNTVRKGKLIKEFGIQYLDKLTPQELQDLAQRQAMAKTIE